MGQAPQVPVPANYDRAQGEYPRPEEAQYGQGAGLENDLAMGADRYAR